MLIKSGTDIKKLQTKFASIVEKTAHLSPGTNAVYSLQPLQSIHLHSNLMAEAEPNADGSSVYLLLGVAVFVILIAWINYINLATARGMGRAKEVGVRKTLGSAKYQLIAQFMLEAILVNGFAVILSIVLIVTVMPFFAQLSGLALKFTLLFSPVFWIAVLGMFVAGSFFSGFYPALVLSNSRPVEVMKGKLRSSAKEIILRKGMVVFQFAASIFLLIGSLTVYKQIRYMQNQKLGINIDQTLVIKSPLGKLDSTAATMAAFKQQGLSQSAVKSITRSTAIPGERVNWNAGGIKLHGQDELQGKQYRIVGGDEDFLSAYGMKVLAGRIFSKVFGKEAQNVVLNR